MIVKKPITFASALLAIIGLSLLLVGFFLVVPLAMRTAVAWLDLFVCGAVFLANFSNFPIVRPRDNGFSGEIPKLGVLWLTHIVYSSLALGGMWYGWTAEVSFALQLFYHLVLLFGLLVAVSVAGKAAQHAGRVASTERRLGDSLQTLKAAIADCEAGFLRLGNGWAAEYSQLRQIKEEVRYLSPCDAPNAVSLDLEMACLIGELTATLSPSDPFGPRTPKVLEALTRCQTLMRLRKQERHV